MDIDGLCELVEELHCQKDNWMMLSVPNKNDGWFVRPGMPSELQAMPGHANIWEVLIRWGQVSYNIIYMLLNVTFGELLLGLCGWLPALNPGWVAVAG